MTATVRYLLICLALPLARPASPSDVGSVAQTRELYYLVRPDARRCARPACGGAWLRAVNQGATRCLGGAQGEQCYVAVVDYSALRIRDWHRARFDSASQAAALVLRGALLRRAHPRFGRVPTLVVSEVWLARAETVPLGPSHLVRDSKVRCVTTPCFSLRAAQLNDRGSPVSISALDLEALELSDSLKQAALSELDRSGLIVTGNVRTVPRAGPAGDGRELVATQLWSRFRIR